MDCAHEACDPAPSGPMTDALLSVLSLEKEGQRRESWSKSSILLPGLLGGGTSRSCVFLTPRGPWWLYDTLSCSTARCSSAFSPGFGGKGRADARTCRAAGLGAFLRACHLDGVGLGKGPGPQRCVADSRPKLTTSEDAQELRGHWNLSQVPLDSVRRVAPYFALGRASW